MDTLLRAGLSNAAAACALAMLAAAVGYFCRRPAVRHALWLMVLLKLVTPPLIDVPVWRAAPAAAAAATEEPAPPGGDPLALGVEVRPAPAEDEGPVPEAAEQPAVPEEGVVVVAPPAAEDDAPAPQPEAPRPEPAAVPAIAWRPLVAAVWLGGSALWLLLVAVRGRRFARLLRYAQPAPAWMQREADNLAKRMRLSGAPALRLVPGRVSPMLWAPGWSARLLLPAELLGRLDAAGRRTLLAHELAHLRRGDHRVRLFELLVTALFWWHPVVWWARRELREAEELCCDAWVLWALPDSGKPYALALVETVDFLSESPAALPALASGVGHVHDLRRRVTMIMQGTTPRALTWAGVLGLVGLGAFLLPVSPGWAQEEEQPPVRFLVKPGEDPAPKEADELRAIKAEIERKRAELAKAEAELKALEARLAKGAGATKAEERGVLYLRVMDGDKEQIIKLPAGVRIIGSEGVPQKGNPDAKAATEEARKKLDALAAELKKKAEAAAKAQPKGKGLVIEIISDGKRQVIALPPGSRALNESDVPKVPGVRWEVMPGQPVPLLPPAGVEVKPGDSPYRVVRPGTADTEKRLADLEKRLEELMRSVKELRGELHQPKGIVPAPKAPPGAIEVPKLPKPNDSANPFQGAPVPKAPQER